MYYYLHERLPGVREGIRRSDRPVCGRRRGAQQPRAVPDVPAEHAQGRRRDAAGREDPAEPRALPREPGAVLGLQRRLPGRRAGGARDAGARAVRRCWRWPSPSWDRASWPEAADDLSRPGEDRRAGRVVHGVRSRRPGDCTRAASRTPARILTQGAAADLASKDTDRAANKFAALAYTQLLRRQKAAAIAAAEQGAGEQPGREDPIPGRAGVRRGGRDREGRRALGRASAPNSRPSLRPTRKIIDGLTALKNGTPRRAIKDLTRGQRPARHVDRPLRSRAGLSGSRRVPAGRFRVRSLPQAPRRGPVAVPGRGAHVRLLPARLLLPGPRARRR